MKGIIYLDNNATTQPLPEVVEAMLPFLRESYANPSSVHQFGQTARHHVECAREQVASLIGGSPREIVFTGSGTESINLAMRGAMNLNPERRRIVLTPVEHPAVLRVAERLEAEGYSIDYVGVDGQGRIDEAEWADRMSDETALASLLHANNETGVVTDVAKLAGIAADHGVPVHVDAVQSAGKLPIDVGSWPVALVSFSAHKFHGPKGVGALFVRRRTRLAPLIVGGNQERELRGGTENVAGIVGMGAAAEAAVRDGEDVARSVLGLRDSLERGISEGVAFAQVNASGAERIYNTTNISFRTLEAEAILILLSEAGVCASSGSACSSGSLEPSHVLKAMDVDERVAHGAVRFSLSRFTTAEEVNHVVALMPRLLDKLTVLQRH